MHWYQYKYRGFSLGCQPKDFVDNNPSIGQFGAVAYDRKLTDKEVSDYELEYIKEEDSVTKLEELQAKYIDKQALIKAMKETLRQAEREAEAIADEATKLRFGGKSYYEYMRGIKESYIAEGGVEVDIEDYRVTIVLETAHVKMRMMSNLYLNDPRRNYYVKYKESGKESMPSSLPKKYAKENDLMFEALKEAQEKYQLIETKKLWGFGDTW